MFEKDTAREGRFGENLTAKHYRKMGYSVLEQNYRTRQGEIDLIVCKEQTLVFVEVKTRNADAIAQPAEFVTAEKQKKLILAAKGYLMRHKDVSDYFMRFDVAEVTVPKWGRAKFRCIENAFTL